MNNPTRVIAHINVAHFLDHYAMLVFPAAAVAIGPALGLPYDRLLALATPGFVAFGAGSLLMGWLGDRWSRRHMMALYYPGLGLALIAAGLATDETSLAVGLFAVGIAASIYHPVGTAMLVGHADRLGPQVGVNGMFGNLGVALSALCTAALSQWIGWRWAFIVPGAVAVLAGLAFLRDVRHEPAPVRSASGGSARVGHQAMRRVVASLVITVVANSTTFNAVTVALPKLLVERLSDLTASPLAIGGIAAGVYLFGAATQFTIGRLLDRHSLRGIFLPLAVFLAPLLVLAAGLHGAALIGVLAGIVAAMFGQVTINDAMVGKYTSDAWRARAFAARYFLGFTAAGASVGLVAWLHARGGFTLTLQALGGLCVLIILGAAIFPPERSRAVAPAAEPAV